MPEIIITEFINDEARRSLAADFDVHYDPELFERAADLRGLAAESRALVVRNRTQVDVALLDAATSLEAVGRLGVGLDNIDLEACRTRGVQVFPATGANTLAVAEYVVAGALMLLRGAYQCTGEVAAGQWPRSRYIGREAQGKTLGLVGFGEIARAVATRARALGLELLAHDPYVDAGDPAWAALDVRSAGFGELLAASDVVSLHVPLTGATRNLLGAAELAAMKPHACLVNTARGGVVDEGALAAALRAGRLAGAMLDVFEHEPLAADSPLADVPGLVLTPHIAGVTEESNERVGNLIAARIRAALEERT